MTTKRGPLTDAERIAELERMVRALGRRDTLFYDWPLDLHQGSTMLVKATTRFRVDNGVVQGWFTAQVTNAAGSTAGHAVTFAAPPGLILPTFDPAPFTAGVCTYLRAPTNLRFVLAIERHSATRFRLVNEDTGPNEFGNVPQFAIATGDHIRGQFSYPLA